MEVGVIVLFELFWLNRRGIFLPRCFQGIYLDVEALHQGSNIIGVLATCAGVDHGLLLLLLLFGLGLFLLLFGDAGLYLLGLLVIGNELGDLELGCLQSAVLFEVFGARGLRGDLNLEDSRTQTSHRCDELAVKGIRGVKDCRCRWTLG